MDVSFDPPALNGCENWIAPYTLADGTATVGRMTWTLQVCWREDVLWDAECDAVHAPPRAE